MESGFKMLGPDGVNGNYRHFVLRLHEQDQSPRQGWFRGVPQAALSEVCRPVWRSMASRTSSGCITMSVCPGYSEAQGMESNAMKVLVLPRWSLE
jgi:hypothetical protein